MKAVKAHRKDFFPPGGHPVAVIQIHGDASPQHEGDLTNIRHFHDFSELVIITEGYGVHWIDGEDHPVTAGDVFVLQGRTEHYFKKRRELGFYNILYDGNYLNHDLRTLRGDAGYKALFVLEPNYRRRHRFKSRLRISRRSLGVVGPVLHRMLLEQEEREAGYDTMLLSDLLELCVYFSREYSKVKVPQARALYRLGEIIGRLETCYDRNWSVSELARSAGMSKSGLMATFKEATGHSPIAYLIRIRIQKAAELLLETDLYLDQIAERCGFSDSNYLSRQFKMIHGQSPREFRKKSAFRPAL